MLKKLGILLAAILLFLLGGAGGYLYAEKKFENEFRAKVKKVLVKTGLYDHVKVGDYSVSLLKRAGSLENVRLKPSVKDYGSFLVGLRVIKRITFLNYKEDPQLEIPTSLKAVFEGVDLFIEDKKKGVQLPLSLSGLYWLNYQPQTAFLNTGIDFKGNLFELKEDFALEGIAVSLIETLKELFQTGQVNPADPKTTLLFSKLLQIKPKKFYFRYYDRGFMRSFVKLLSDDPQKDLENAVKEIEEDLRKETSPHLRAILKGIRRAFKEGKGGFEVLLVNKEGLSFQDFGTLFFAAGNPEKFFRVLSSKIEIQVKEL